MLSLTIEHSMPISSPAARGLTPAPAAQTMDVAEEQTQALLPLQLCALLLLAVSPTPPPPLCLQAGPPWERSCQPVRRRNRGGPPLLLQHAVVPPRIRRGLTGQAV